MMPEVKLTMAKDDPIAAKIILKAYAGFKFMLKHTRTEPGPVVTTYYFEPKDNTPLAKILNKGEDFALSIATDEPVTINRVGGEIAFSVPRKDRQIINFDECMHWLGTSPATAEMRLPILMGKNPTGAHFALDLAELPHMLIAGTTGAGKSVFQSEILCSLALLKSPKELQLVLVDTKKLDLTMFRELKHVVGIADDEKTAMKELNSLLAIVRQRGKKMTGVARNIDEYNQLLKTTGERPLPHIVLVIDELADLFGLDPDTKEKVQELSQIARASGVHIIAATQRPSVKVIPGDAKVNFTRLSLKLPTAIDSKVILGEGGAEKLLGRGDYLYITSTGMDAPARGHGAFVEAQTIFNLVARHDELRENFRFMREMSQKEEML